MTCDVQKENYPEASRNTEEVGINGNWHILTSRHGYL